MRKMLPKNLADAKKLKEQIEKVTVEMKAKSGEGGRLFGSITTKQIADELNKKEGIKVDRRKMDLPDANSLTWIYKYSN